MDDDHHQNDYGKMKCAMVLCTDGGPAYELKWCPLPSHDQVWATYSTVSTDADNLFQLSDHASEVRPRKLGLLAGSFEDGSLSIYVVPEPIDVTPPDHDASQPVYGALMSYPNISAKALTHFMQSKFPNRYCALSLKRQVAGHWTGLIAKSSQ